MGDTDQQVIQYQNRLKELVKRDYIYLFIGLIVVAMAFGFLYTQFNPGKPIYLASLFKRNEVIDRESFQEAGNIAGLIEKQKINFISPTHTDNQGGLTNPNPTSAESLSTPEENGQISAIASGQVTNASTTYTVQEGDNLAYIAGIMYGDRDAWVTIAEANGLLENPDAIYAGMVLVIPR